MLDDFQDDDEITKGGDFLDEFRQRLNSQPLENFENRKDDINRSQHIFLGTILGIGLAGVVSWFILAPDYSQTQDAEIPVVRRPQTAIKVLPADPGGMEILNQDKTIYDIVEKKDSEDIKVENLLPPPEEPKLPTVIAEPETPTEIKIADSAVIKDAERIIAAEEKKEEQKKLKPKEEPKKEEIKEEPKEEIKIVIKKETPEIKTVETPKAETVQIKTSATDSFSAPAGTWQIQLISSPNKSAMEKSWTDMTKKHSVLKDLPHEIEAADLGAKGTFYRLKAGAFQNRSDADKICNAVKSAGGSCLVKKK